MRNTLVTLGLVVAIFAGFVAQEFIPPIAAADGARVFLAPALFCFGACVLPFPSMLALALVSGFLSDFSSLQVIHHTVEAADLDTLHAPASAVELSAGWSILLFLAIGLFCQGLRPLVLRGNWWLPPLMSAASTAVYLALQFAMLTIRRFDSGGLFWSETVAWRILVPAAIAAAITLALVLVEVMLGGLDQEDHRGLRDY